MLKFLNLLKNNWLDFLIIFLIIILNLFWLPTFSFWGLYPSTVKSISDSKISQFEFSQTPIVKLANKPVINASNYILIDVDTNKILVSQNPNTKIYPASTTKLATALTALNIYPLDEVITVDQEYTEGKVMELKLGEKITVKSLVSALLVYSANDAAFTLAKHQQFGVTGFIDQMNLLVKKYGLKNTNFVNFDGLQNENHYSTVYDLSQLGRISIKNPIVKNTVKNKQLTVSSVDNTIVHDLVSTNELLEIVPEIEGLKTGWTPEAKGCFIGLVNLDGHYLISVVAQSDDRFQDTKTIIQWARENIYWQN
ncbi:MAG: D-alanyl-D-alanine carboxypeptidase [Candidatus Shapirobacteria bacterium]|nr:D-alanyl-D-alanine carboxypeptidase [Candidatus Shapirobacteria bacterium]